MQPVIEVRALEKRYGRTIAVDDLTFQVAPGTVTGFLGPNGAGKTTTMRAILGLIRPNAGETRVLGAPYRSLDDAVLKVGALIDGEGFHPGRTARAHLRTLTGMAGIASERVDEVLDIVELTEAADRRVGTFSLGMRQRLGLAGAIIGDPHLLLLDEPANGLDPAGIRWMRSFLRSYADSGRTAFVSSHVLTEMAHLVDEVVVVRQGKLVTHTTMSDLVAGDHVVVDTSDNVRLTKALEQAGAVVGTLTDGRIRVQEMTPDRVGEVARSEGVTLHELARSTNTLEDVFLQLTAGEQQHV